MSNNTEQTSESKVNIKHKDRLFNFIFGSEENKKWTLALYNAVNGSNHTDESEIRFNTLGNMLYVSMKNDTSFIFSATLNLYEHQSTYNPNMPLRMMRYIGNIYYGYIEENDYNLFGSELIKLPVPKLVVFYNGKKEMPDESILRLSDSFEGELRDKADIEVRVRMLNINYDHNKELMLACKPLREYAWFVDKIRKNSGMLGSLDEAVGRACNEMPEDYEIKPFLRVHMAEVVDMLMAESHEINALNLVGRAERKKGREEGREEGSLRTLVKQVIRKMKKEKTVDEMIEDLEEDRETIERIYKTAKLFAPDYDEDKIVEVILGKDEPQDNNR